jgi:hypothetical protein
MGIFFETRFYPNISDSKTYIVLSSIDRILQFDGMERGWIKAEDLLRICHKEVSPTQLTTNSWVVETLSTTLAGAGAATAETIRLPVY